MVVANEEGLRNWGLLSRNARLEVKWTEERLDSVREGGTTPSSVIMMAGESREPWGPADGLWGDRRPAAFVGDRLWTGDVVSRGGILSSSAVRFVVTMARMLWSSEGMTEREGA
jgi:hypothetical protein